MPGLTVYLNREGLNTIETDKAEVRATERVDVVLENHGKPTHVHLHLDDDLATMGTVEESNWFVPTDEYREVSLYLSEGASGNGRLEITTGYGQERSTVDVAVTPPEEESQDASTVSADPSEPRVETRGEVDPGGQSGSSIGSEMFDYDRLRNPTTMTAGVAVALGFLTLLLIDPILGVSAGVLAVLSGLAVFSYLVDWHPLGQPESEE